MLLNLVKYQRSYIDKIYLNAKDSFRSKYQLLINGRKKVGIKNLKKSKSTHLLFLNKLMKFTKTKKIIIQQRKEDY